MTTSISSAPGLHAGTRVVCLQRQAESLLPGLWSQAGSHVGHVDRILLSLAFLHVPSTCFLLDPLVGPSWRMGETGQDFDDCELGKEKVWFSLTHLPDPSLSLSPLPSFSLPPPPFPPSPSPSPSLLCRHSPIHPSKALFPSYTPPPRNLQISPDSLPWSSKALPSSPPLSTPWTSCSPQFTPQLHAQVFWSINLPRELRMSLLPQLPSGSQSTCVPGLVLITCNL